MRKKRIASKLLSLLLSAAVIVSSSFSGITLMDVSATQTAEQVTVAVSDNTTEDVADAETVSENEIEEEIVEGPVEEVVTDEEPEVGSSTDEPVPVQDSSMQDREIITAPQPYVSAEDYASMEGDTKEKDVRTSFSLGGDGKYAVAGLTPVEIGVEDTLGVVEGQQTVAAPEKATTTPSDSALVTSLVGETVLAEALRQIYNEDYNTGSDISIGSFKFSHLKKMTGVVDLSDATNAPSITKATGIGYLVNATEISLVGTGITYIPASEFWKNTNLVTITLPDTLVGFGDSAFNGCTALVNINSSVANNTLPSYLDDAKMGSSVFAGCTALTNITIPNMTQDTYALLPATSMFSGCTALTSVTVGADVSVIPNSCFVGAGDKTSGMTITFQAGSVLDTLMDSAFQYCNISEIDLSNCSKLSRIGVRCFTPRKSTAKKTETTECKVPLTKVTLPASNTTLKTNGVSIGDEAFFYAPIETIAVGTTSVTGKVILPNYVKELGVAAFYGNDAMQTLQLSANIPVINKFTFAECTALTDVTVDTANNSNTCAIVGIANQAFYNATKLGDADFLVNMNNLTYIGEEAYVVEKGDEEIDIITYFSYKTDGYSSKKLYASAVFTGTAIASATLPASLRTIGAYAFGSADDLATVTWKTDSTLAAGEKYIIGSDAFTSCASLRSFVYPTTGTKKVSFEIGGRAFAYDEILTNFATSDAIANASANVLPYALTHIGGSAFGACTSLEYMKMTSNVNGVCPEIDPGVFAICNNLHTVELPKSIKEIPEDMFYDCALQKFPLPDGANSLEKIGYAAFFGNQMQTVDLSAHTKLHTIGTIAFAYHDPYEEAKDENGNDVTIVADEILTTVVVDGVEVTVAETTLAPLTTLILPDAVTGTYSNMVWGDNMLQAAGKFTTLKTKSRGTAGQVYVPNYVQQSGVGVCVFAATAVTKATWEYATKTSGAYVWTGIPDGMFALTPVSKISDCCIPVADVYEIGSLAYAGTKITEADLTVYPYLLKTGDGTFALCSELAKVKLPKNGLYAEVSDYLCLVGNFENSIGMQTVDQHARRDSWRSVLREIDFGTVKTIGDFAFATLDVVSSNKELLEEIDITDALTKLDFSVTKVESLGEGAFAGNTALQTVNFKGIKEIGDLAFVYCTNMNLSYDEYDATAVNPLADSIESIGGYAFAACYNIGELVFGSGVKSIGEYAFNACAMGDQDAGEMTEGFGLTRVDFSKATKLVSIGKYAFSDTAIVNFDISNCPVTELKEGVVSNCPFLETIVLGEKVQKVVKNAAFGCLNLGSIDFYSTTTIDLQAFYKKGTYKGFNDEDQVVYITPIDKVNFRLTPVELNVGLGNPMMFPYYVNDTKNGSGEFGEIVIGQANVGSEDPTVHQYVKVMANTSKYYKNNTDPSNIVSDSKYFEKTEELEYSVNNTKVYTFKIQGLKATPANTSIPFSVTSGYTFTAEGSVSAEQTLTAKYNLKVMDILYYPTFYTDKARLYQYDDLKANATTGVTTGTTNIRVGKENTTGKITLYYDITPLYKTNWRPETGNLVIKTSNPDVISFGTGSGVKKVNDTTYHMIAEPDTKTDETLTSLTSGKKLVVTPKKQGSAVVTIYHEDCPSKKVTWNINVKVDIKTMSLTIPSTYKKGMYEGDKFQIVEKITFYIGGSVTRSAGTLGDYAKYTDNKIYYTSLFPKYYTVDSNGLVTIKKSGVTASSVAVLAFWVRPDGTKTEQKYSFDIKYPTFATGKTARSTNGEQVKITKKASGKKPAEVTYLAPADGAVNVTVPATMIVGGVKCKVTSIAEGAFENNKTVKKVKIAKGFTEIPKNMFKGCTKLTSVTLPKTIVTIGDSAFQGCKSLAKITIPKKVQKIGAKAFFKCSKLKKIIVKSKKVTTVGKNAFKGIHKNAVIDVPNSKLKTYKTLFKKGQGKKVKIK